MGYDFAAAVADLVDNSIEAHASLVAIDVEFDGDDSWVRIADNGVGMTASQVREALRYGAEREYEEEDLGKFGLGLKTASLSQCQRLTLASRVNPGRADIAAFCWDLDHIDKTNRWEILPVVRTGLGPAIREPLRDTTGTVVLWQRLDRILGYRHPYGEMARKRLSGMCREVESHLAMVFHRFLSGEIPGRKLKILLNGNQVVPWDPFARSESKTRILTSVKLRVEHEGASGDVKVEPFILPHQQEFSSQEAFKLATGPLNWNQQQGFYVYRAGRLIQSGGWSRLRTADEHTKLARVALSFMPALDDAFKINVAKMRVQLPLQIKDQIEDAIKPVIKIAQERYRKKTPVTSVAAKPSEISGGPTHETDTVISTNTTEPTKSLTLGQPAAKLPATATRLWTLDQLQQKLDDSAKPDEKPVISTVFDRLRAKMKTEGENQ